MRLHRRHVVILGSVSFILLVLLSIDTRTQLQSKHASDYLAELINDSSVVNFPKQVCPPSYGKIALLQLVSGEHYIENVAWNALQSVRCFARMRGYTLYQFTMVGNHLKSGAEPDEMKKLDSVCEYYNAILPKRHCLAAQLLSKYEYVVHIDADSGVVNPHHCFEEYITPNIDLHFLLRVHTGEVQAGHYIAKSSPFSRDFLMKWANHTKEKSIYNDQPVLHTLISKTFLAANQSQHCEEVHQQGYYPWIKCMIGALKESESIVNKVLFYARAQTFVRDGWASQFFWSSTDFMFHAMKYNDDCLFVRKLREEECGETMWTIPVDKKYIVDRDRMKSIWIKREKLFQKIYPDFARIDDMSLCWPNCRHIVG